MQRHYCSEIDNAILVINVQFDEDVTSELPAAAALPLTP